jgi:hypothetical protein
MIDDASMFIICRPVNTSVPLIWFSHVQNSEKYKWVFAILSIGYVHF